MALNQRQMETLSSSLKSSTKKKTKSTQGRVVPVFRQANPYKPLTPPRNPAQPSANALGALAQQQSMASRPPVSTALNVSYESDPVLARIRALGTQDVANARSEAEALKKKAIIESGLSDVGQQIGLDAGTVQAAANNPFGTKQEIERQQAARGRELDESMNSQNLFYSGHRANQLSELAHSGAAAQTGLNSSIQSLLGEVGSNLTAAERAQAEKEQEAAERAAEIARQNALQQSYLDSMNASQSQYADLQGQYNGLQTHIGEMSTLNQQQQQYYADLIAHLQAGTAAPLTPQVEVPPPVAGMPPTTYGPIDPVSAYSPTDNPALTPWAPMVEDPLTNAGGVPLSIVGNTGGQFLTPDTAAQAGVNPYYYDPYEAAVPATPVFNSGPYGGGAYNPEYNNAGAPITDAPSSIQQALGTPLPVVQSAPISEMPSIPAPAPMDEISPYIAALAQVDPGPVTEYTPEPTPQDPYAGMQYWPDYGWMPIGWNPPSGGYGYQ